MPDLNNFSEKSDKSKASNSDEWNLSQRITSKADWEVIIYSFSMHKLPSSRMNEGNNYKIGRRLLKG